MNHRALLTFSVASLGLAVAIDAFAAPPAPSSPPQSTPALPKLDAADLRLKELKAIKPLTTADKMKLLQASGGGAGADTNLEPVIKLSPRTAWHSVRASLDFFSADTVSTENDAARFPYVTFTSGLFKGA